MSPNTNNPATRRPMEAEDYLDALRRRRTWLFGPLLAGLVQFLGWTASLTLGILLMAGAIGYHYAARV